jgi:hypothetical protein
MRLANGDVEEFRLLLDPDKSPPGQRTDDAS